MIKTKLVIFFLFFFNVFNIVQAAGKIAYIDIDFLLNQSIAGKSITKKLETQYNNDIAKFKIAEKKLIDEENKKEPYSDEKLEKLIKKEGYNIARRTISKYREQLNIPVSRLRKDF